ncbi:MAG TPA: HAMP domain-containing sensor histidine kinase, partial [Parafilimonas sp.]
KPIDKPQQSADKIYTHKAYDSDEHKKALQRTIEFNIYVNNAWYVVNVSKSLEGADKLIQTIIVITLIIILLILAVAFFINRVVLGKLWQPFYSTLKTMRQFSLNNTQKLDFSNTNIDEFSYLNSTLSDALTKAQQDYQSLKEFTENASHELQTPLAVIQSKLDILIQNEKLSEAEGKTIQGAYDAVQHLKKLNQSLLLLAKIENNQFSEKNTINISQLMQNKINQFADLWKSKNIITSINIKPATLYANSLLIDILLNNLLSNATNHNFQNGSLTINLETDKLGVINTGSSFAVDEKFLFKRFSKSTNAADGHGLGLSIIQEICKTSGYNCSYIFSAPNFHSFNINW